MSAERVVKPFDKLRTSPCSRRPSPSQARVERWLAALSRAGSKEIWSVLFAGEFLYFRFISTLDEGAASGKLWADGDGRWEQPLLFEFRVGEMRVG